MSWRKHFTPVDNSGLPLNVSGTQDTSMGGASSYNGFESWLPEVYAGSPSRIMRYLQYENMDSDSEVNTALDTIAEFGTQEEEDTGLPFAIVYNDDPTETESKIITQTLEQWCNLNELYKRAFRIFRNTIKFGDQFFLRDPETYKLYWVDPANVEKVIVNESKGKKIETYYIKNIDPIFGEMVGTQPTTAAMRPFGSNNGMAGLMGHSNSQAAGSYTSGLNSGDEMGVPVPAEHVVHISLTEGMSTEWPFGMSILEPVFKTFKQKELLEDSIIIYRVHRAPERRVFFIDVGNMPPHRARQYLEQVKYEVQQKRLPGKNSQGGNIADSAYNPMCLDLSTRIPLLDGRTLELQELITEYQAGKENWVYSTNPETGSVVPGNITWAGTTRTNAETIKITLDNDKEIICTPDHKIPVLGKGFVEAKDLTVNDPLISFETRQQSLSRDPNRSYTQVYDHEHNDWIFVHRLVAEFFRNMNKHQVFHYLPEYIEADKNTVHHKDYNRYNNEPRNLQWMNAKDHVLYHSHNKQDFWANLSEEESTRIKDKIRVGLEKYRHKNQDEFQQRYINRDTTWINDMKENDPERYAAWRKNTGKSRKAYLDANPDKKAEFASIGANHLKENGAENQYLDFTQQMLTRLVEIVKTHNSNREETIRIVNNDNTFMSLLKEANPSQPNSTNNVNVDKFTDSKLKIMYRKYGYAGWKDFKEKTKVYNHRIKKIEIVERRDVGTITVDYQEKWHAYHTFAVDAGIFVKNSMLEDYYFAQTADGRGSRVDTLPGGENLGDIDDLKFFNNKLMRSLRVPSSYLPTGPEDGTATYNDGKVGIAYIQEYRFSEYVKRLQRQVQEDLDKEFKMFLKYRGIDIDSGTFYIEFNKPMNFSTYKEIQLDSERASLFGQVEGIPYLSKQFKLRKYLGLTEDEIIENEAYWFKENDKDSAGEAVGDDMAGGDLSSMGIRPEDDAMVDPEAEVDLDDLEDFDDAGMDDMAAQEPVSPPQGPQ